MKIVTVIGARPQFIKAACLSKEFKKNSNFEEVIIHTGQHFDKNMSDIFFEEMEIPKPKYCLNVNSLAHGAMTGQMLEKVEEVLEGEKPDWVLIYGDTNSTLAGALAAKKLNINLAHIESGLRNFDFAIPEEINRIIADRLADLLTYSTDVAYKNLENEGFRNFPCTMLKTDDILVDAVLSYSSISEKKSNIISQLGLVDGEYILCEFHRASNTEVNQLENIVEALNEISNSIKIVIPIHPRTRNSIQKNKLQLNAQLIDPVGYIDMLSLMKHSRLIITDSGGLQREGYILKKKSLLLMEYTPWEELVDNGFSVTSKIEKNDIVKNYTKILSTEPDFSIKLYGNGNASKQIANFFLEWKRA